MAYWKSIMVLIEYDSGPAFLKAAGHQGGAGQIIGRALEDSNTDTTDEFTGSSRYCQCDTRECPYCVS